MALRRLPSEVTLHRFFLSPKAFQSERVVFPPEQAHQIRNVLRLKTGDRVVALDGTGAEVEVRLSGIGRDVQGTVEERRWNEAEPKTSLTLYQGLLKAAKLELVLQKGTEIGVMAFVPIVTQRSIPSDTNPSRQRRFEAIVREAAEQSRRGRLPLVAPAVSFQEALARACNDGPAVLLWEDERNTHLDDLPAWQQDEAINLFIGPEGGFTLDEVAQARDAGAHVVTLGRRILRSETAAVVGTALILSRTGDLG